MNIQRLSAIWRFQHDTPSALEEVSLFLNDGVARIFDITEQTNTPKQVLRWFVFACIHHMASSHADSANGFVGARGVMSFGERVLLGEEIQSLSDYMSGPAEVHARFGRKVCAYSPKEFQLNLAFSRAYLIESGGKSVGLEHPSLYVDAAALDALENLLNNVSSDEMIGQNCDALGIPKRIVTLKRTYKVERGKDAKAFKFCVLRKTDSEFQHFVEFIFAVPEIPFSKRGIVTTLHRLERIIAADELRQLSENVIRM